MKTIPVVCAVIIRENKVFIARKRPDKSNGGLWEFPGGKIQINESEEEALQRELIEELGLRVIIKQRLKSVKHFYPEKSLNIELIPFVCEFVSMDSGVMTDHDKYEWIGLKELDNYNMAAADTPIIGQIKGL